MALEAELKKLISRRDSIEKEVRKAKAELARQAGEVFDSIDEITCDEHPGRVMIVLDHIPGSKHKKALNRYGCKDSFHIIPQAYDCPNCGVVKGTYTEYKQDRTQGNYAIKATFMSCRICGLELGESSWKWDVRQLFRYTA